MKISCGACGASYTIADEKVAGKTVRVKCKKCSNLIVINPAEAAAAEEWSVSLDDGEPKTMSLVDLIALVRTAKVPADAYVWKEGMGDWKVVTDIPELAAVLPTNSPGAGKMAATGRGSNLFGSRGEGDVKPRVAPSPSMADAAAEADKRIGERNDTSVLFSLSAIGPGGAQGSKGLSAATAKGSTVITAPVPTTGVADDASGLIDMRMLAGVVKGSAAAKKDDREDRIDDIMNLGGSALFAQPSLLAPPPVNMPSPPLGQPTPRPAARAAATPSRKDTSVAAVDQIDSVEQADQADQAKSASPSPVPATPKGGKMTLLLGFGAGVLVLVIALFFLLSKKDEGAELAAAEAASAPVAVVSTAPSSPDPPRGAAASAPVAVAAPVVHSTNPSDLPNEAVGGDTKKAHGGEKRSGDVKRPGDDGAKAPPPRPEEPAPAPVKAPEKKEAPAAPVAPASEGGEFDRSAALSALGAMASAAASCKTADGPTGSGRVSVTFAPSGNATQAAVDGPPFAGTTVGGCIASKFRSAKVPAFSGAPVTVKKSFSIN